MASCVVNLRMCIRDAEPDGSECLVCGQDVYLSASAMGVLAGPDDFVPLGTICQSCTDAIKGRCQTR